MSVLDRSELEASSLADLHAIADQIGLEGFRRLRKADLIDAILGEPGTATNGSSPDAGEVEAKAQGAPRRRRRIRRASSSSAEDSAEGEEAAEDESGSPEAATAGSGIERPRRARSRSARGAASERGSRADGERRERDETEDSTEPAATRAAEGVVEVLGNGSAFLRVHPPEPSDEDVYVSAAQVRRCELVSGDRVTGPVRTPRRSERYSSLVRIDTINGASADTVSDGSRYEDLPVAWPSERLALGSDDPTLEAIEWLTPLGRGSRAVIVGGRNAGKTETLRRLLGALAGSEDLDVSLVIVGARPEEIADWREGPVAPAEALSFAASAELQGQAVERAIDGAKRIAARGGHAVVLVDSLDDLHPQAARKALAAARNLQGAGSLTLLATATEPLGGETTVIALDASLAAAGRVPILDLAASATLRPELLVGEDGAEAIAKAWAAALQAAV
ncbi:MAG TPA: Rho termination factor N-terminal domain-containing protein [Solirubrobacteraceae bacterium]|nr:Rho termination factor N-terminal domain-containing protein [Solirubrobacteraceae bacterium]